jgi:hypothetical protein
MNEVTLLYAHTTVIGYGRLGVKLHEALSRGGTQVYDAQGSPEIAPHTLAEMIEQQGFSVAQPPTATVCWVTQPGHARGWWAGQHPALFTMWEATVLPEDFRAGIDNFERVLVPSEQNVELFSLYHPDVRLVPLGIDPREWHPIERPAGDAAFFRFLIGGSGTRKGTDLAFEAFERVFGRWFRGQDYVGPRDRPVPQLVMKNPRGEEFDAPWLEMIRGRLTDEAEQALYAGAHVYLQPSRGEGFGLQPLQAMAQGCPTILTDAHGHAAFAHLGIPLSYTMSPSTLFLFGDAGDWYEPNLEELCEAMWWTFEHYDEATSRAHASAEVIAREFSWDRCAERFRTEMAGLIDAPRVGTNGAWIKPTARRYLLRVTKPWSADIAGITYGFEVGKDYYEPSDVKRIMFEAGLLHPSCVRPEPGSDTDLGLTETQVARLDDYTAAHSYCPTCHQRYGSGVTKADAIYAEMTG